MQGVLRDNRQSSTNDNENSCQINQEEGGASSSPVSQLPSCNRASQASGAEPLSFAELRRIRELLAAIDIVRKSTECEWIILTAYSINSLICVAADAEQKAREGSSVFDRELDELVVW